MTTKIFVSFIYTNTTDSSAYLRPSIASNISLSQVFPKRCAVLPTHQKLQKYTSFVQKTTLQCLQFEDVVKSKVAKITQDDNDDGFYSRLGCSFGKASIADSQTDRKIYGIY